jgi:large subunit ribosomal protein L19
MNKIQFVESQLLTPGTFPNFVSGDNIIVNYKIIEGDKTRVQAFKGDVINIKGQGRNKAFTVRKISHGVGVERVFQFANPNIEDIQLVKKGKVRRAKLFYLRGLVGKKARIKEKAYSAADFVQVVKPAAVAQVVEVAEQVAEVAE